MGTPSLFSWAVLVSQLLGKLLLPNRRTFKCFSENIPGRGRVGSLQPDGQHFKQTLGHCVVVTSNALKSFNRNL